MDNLWEIYGEFLEYLATCHKNALLYYCINILKCNVLPLTYTAYNKNLS